MGAKCCGCVGTTKVKIEKNKPELKIPEPVYKTWNFKQPVENDSSSEEEERSEVESQAQLISDHQDSSGKKQQTVEKTD
jgi:hypothetical protein